MQPLARLRGRLEHGLTIWRRRGETTPVFPRPRANAIWTERWESPDARPYQFTAQLQEAGQKFRYGGSFDPWDIYVPGGILGGARMLMAVEDHGGGAHYIRVRFWPRLTKPSVVGAVFFLCLAAAAVLNGAPLAAVLLGLFTLGFLLRSCLECAIAMGALTRAYNNFELELTEGPK